MNIALYGIGLGGGIVIGNVHILDKYLDDATVHFLEEDEVNAEVHRFEAALKDTRRELELLRNQIPHDAPAELGAFLSLSIMMLNDSQVSQVPINLIKEQQCNAEWAIKLQADKLSAQFDDIEDEYLKERKHDVIQVLEKIFKNLKGNQFDWQAPEHHDKQQILVTHDLSPADLVQFKQSSFVGFITEVGSLTSHTAIIGRNLDLPAVVGVSYARQMINDSDLVIVDGVNGVLIINPDQVVLNEYKALQQGWKAAKAKLKQIRLEPATTEDGVTVQLFANVEDLNDINEVKHNNASGIGLFRSEFLFLTKENHLADEEEQFEIYQKLAKTMKKMPAIVRTADLGADKNPLWNNPHEAAANPALGLTGIRLSLAEQNFFRTQLRAILRASVYGNIAVMFPMISNSMELKQAINQLNYAKDELRDEGVGFNNDIRVGAMIEIPSIALSVKSILPLVDFISIGTNDLIQYLLAIDRNDESVNYLYNPLHPAVLKLIYYVIKSANQANIPVSICGEMAGNSKLTRLLLGLGLRQFSMYSANLLSIKNIIRNTNIESINKLVRKIMRSEHIEKIEELLDELNSDLE